MRALLILFRRQLADDFVYLVPALGLSIVLLLFAFVFALFYDPYAGVNRYLLLPTTGLLGAFSVLVFVGSYALGAAQAHGDRSRGVSAILSTSPVGTRRITMARILTHICLLIIVLFVLTLVVAGAVFFELVPGRGFIRHEFQEWPRPFRQRLLLQGCAAVFLIAFVSYCLSLQRGQTSRTFLSALCMWPLSLVVASLILVKGFGWPLLAILGPLIGVLLIGLLATSRHNVLATLATGSVFCVLFAVLVFWGRFLCDVTLFTRMGAGSSVKIVPSGLFPLDTEVKGQRSMAYGEFPKSFLVFFHLRVPQLAGHLGIFRFCESGFAPQYDFRNLSGQWWARGGFSDATGQLVCLYKGESMCLGPRGVASEPDERLGRFGDPIIGDGVMYDKASSRFYVVDLDAKTIHESTPLMDRQRQPVDIISRVGKSDVCYVGLRSEDWSARRWAVHTDPVVLDEAGKIALLDRRTLELHEPLGSLPRPRTLFGRGSAKPRDLLGYDVEVVVSDSDQRYLGTVAGSLSRQGTSMALAVFDRDGNEVKTACTEANPVKVPRGATAMIAKYVVESLHPPILTLASFLTAYRFEAGATHRAIFVMPNSFVALQRDRQTNAFFQFLWAWLFLVPALLFAGFLSWRAAADAAVAGLPQKARWAWLVCVLAFGLPAYVTYRLTHRKITLVTCRNCGRGRRPDQDRCHRCGSGWDMPELDPPGWRVVGESRKDGTAL